MTELAYVLELKSKAERRAGSSPVGGITPLKKKEGELEDITASYLKFVREEAGLSIRELADLTS